MKALQKLSEGRRRAKGVGGATHVAKKTSARQRLLKRITEVAVKYRPKRTKIRWKRKGTLPAYAYQLDNKSYEILSPRPTCTVTLAIFIHECMHVRLGHTDGREDLPPLIYEWLCEKTTIDILRAENIPVDKDVMEAARSNVALYLRPGRPAPRYILKWLGKHAEKYLEETKKTKQN
jgi:hypothetical protein